MKRLFLRTLVTLGLALAASVVAHAQGLDCMIQPDQIIQVGSPVAGLIERVRFERGEFVNRGQVIAQLKADVERAALDLARARMSQLGEIVAARSSLEFARRELERSNELLEQNFVSENYVDKQRTEVEVAGGRTDQAQEKRVLAEKEVALAEAQLALRIVRAPISGIIVERFLSAGEHVDDKPIVRIASVDPLRVDVLVPAAAFGLVKIGMRGKVIPEMINRSEHLAVVRIVDRVIEPASNTFRVRLELPNPRGTLPAGLRCKVDLGVTLPETPRTSVTSRTALPEPREVPAPRIPVPAEPTRVPTPPTQRSAAAPVPISAAVEPAKPRR